MRVTNYHITTCLSARETTYTNTGYAATTILLRKVHIFQVILARNYMCSLMMISDMLSKHVGTMKVLKKKTYN